MPSIARERLQEMLNWWKLMSLMREIGSWPRQYPHLSETAATQWLRQWRGYERMVLDNRIEHLSPAAWSEQRLPETFEQGNSVFWRYCGAQNFPCELFEWNRTSRRAFHIPEGLQCLFMAGQYSSWKWEDLLWPYESVVLTLEHPLEVEDDSGCWSSYDTILATHVVHPGRGKVLLLRLLKKPHGPRPETLPVKECNLIDKHLATGERIRAMKVATRVEGMFVTDDEIPQGSYTCPVYATFEVPIYPSLRDHIGIEVADLQSRIVRSVFPSPVGGSDEETRLSVFSMAHKIVVGWCAYMGHLHTNSFETVRQPSGKGTRGITGVITTPEHICTMILKSRLDPGRYYTTKEYEVSSGMFKRPHWRRGHWKRENGSAPTAPRTIRVPPMLIRWDLIPIFGVISGTETYIDDDGEL